MTRVGWTGIALTMSLLAADVAPADAAENDVGFYLLSQRRTRQYNELLLHSVGRNLQHCTTEARRSE